MTTRARDIGGQRFERLKVVGKAGSRNRVLYWKCLCDCGRECEVSSSDLVRGRVKSCGCLNQEMRFQRNYKHGAAFRGRKHRLYVVWRAIIDRCTDQNDTAWEYYGGRGIRVCERWKNDYAAFVADMGQQPTPEHKTVDRIDVNGHYEPGNCRWATWSEQAVNRRPRRWKRRPETK